MALTVRAHFWIVASCDVLWTGALMPIQKDTRCTVHRSIRISLSGSSLPLRLFGCSRIRIPAGSRSSSSPYAVCEPLREPGRDKRSALAGRAIGRAIGRAHGADAVMGDASWAPDGARSQGLVTEQPRPHPPAPSTSATITRRRAQRSCNVTDSDLASSEIRSRCVTF